MESECVVCGSPHDRHALRCVVCGVDLPPTLIRTQNQHGEPNTISSLQGLNAPLKLPLSTGVGLRPSISSQSISLEDGVLVTPESDVLLGPEELAISSPPEELQPQVGSASGTLSGIPAVSMEDEHDLTPQRADAQAHREKSPYHLDSGEALRDVRRAIDLSVGDLNRSNPSQEERDPTVDHDLSSASTWVGVPIPQDSIELDVSRLLTPQDGSGTSASLGQRDEVAADIQGPSPERPAPDPNMSTLVGMNPVEGLSSTLLPPIIAREDSTPKREDPPLYRPISSPQPASATPNPLEARYSHHLEEREKREAPLSNGSRALKISAPSSDGLNRDQVASLRSSETSQRGEEVVPAPIALKSQPTHSPTAELMPYRRSKRPSWLLWVGLTLVSVAFGFYLTDYFSSSLTSGGGFQVSSGARAEVKVSAIEYHLDRYHLRLALSSSKTAQLLIPDSWRAIEGEESLAPLSGERSVVLEVPEDQLSLGANTLSAQWIFTDEADIPPRSASLSAWLDWKLIRVDMGGAQSRELLALIQVAAGGQLSGSDAPFEPASHQDQYIVRLSQARAQKTESGAQYVSATLNVTRPQGRALSGSSSAQALRLWWPKEPSDLELHSPSQGYARPDADGVISGKSEPHAAIRVASLKLDSAEVSVEAEASADERGLFTLSVPLHTPGRSVPKAGLTWTARLEVTAPGKLPVTRTVQLKRSHKPTWSAYIARLSRRRDSAMKRYTKFKQATLLNQTARWRKRAGVISGVVGWIDRGLSAKEARALKTQARPQRFLIYTCDGEDRCPIWVRDPQAFWIKVGQRVHVFGVFEGISTHRDALGADLALPELKARLTTP